MNNPIEEARKRHIIQLIQSRCNHRRLGIVEAARRVYQQKIVYCEDCEKILYDLDGRSIKNETEHGGETEAV